MVPEWESMPISMDFGTPIQPTHYSPFLAHYPTPHYTDHTLHVDDLLDFSNNDDLLVSTTNAVDAHFAPPPPSYEHPSVAAAGGLFSDNSSFDLHIPYEEAAELEWLSNFVDESSFSDAAYHQSMGMIAPTTTRNDHSSATANRGARSKRSRAGAGNTPAPTKWSSSLQAQPSSSPSSSSSSSSDATASKPSGIKGKKTASGGEGGVRRCTHCASEKTPQWRTGPLGPKTLCNACGVRYKSGRLVPEYRPAASPTFVLTQHSNSHRKVMELRRQKEFMMGNGASSAAARGARPEVMFNEYGVS